LRLALAGALLTILQHGVAPVQLAASFAGIFDRSLHDFYLQSSAGIAHGIRLFGMLAIVLGLTIRSRWLALAGAGIACLSFASIGHTSTHSPRWLLAPLLTVHVTIVAFWFGSLRPLHRMSDRNHADVAARLERFSWVASRAVPLILVAGLVLAYALLESFAQLLTPYGLMIIGKVSGFALLLGLASVNRWRLVPQIRSGQAAALSSFRKIAAIEWLTMVSLIVATVSVTSLFSP